MFCWSTRYTLHKKLISSLSKSILPTFYILLKAPTKFDADFLLPNGFSYGQHVDEILKFLRFLLKEGDLFLLIHRCHELWDTLIVKSTSCDYAKEVTVFLFFFQTNNEWFL